MEETKILLENLKADIIKGKENKMNPNYFHERLLNIKASLKKEPNRYMVYDFNDATIDIQSEYNKGNYRNAEIALEKFMKHYYQSLEEKKEEQEMKEPNINIEEIIENIDNKKVEIMTELLNPAIAYTSFEMNEISKNIDDYAEELEKNKETINDNKYDEKIDEIYEIKADQERFAGIVEGLEKIIGENREDTEYWTKDVEKFRNDLENKYGKDVANMLSDKLNAIAYHHDNKVNVDKDFKINREKEEVKENTELNETPVENTTEMDTTDSNTSNDNIDTTEENIEEQDKENEQEITEEKNDKEDNKIEENEKKDEPIEKDKKPKKKRCKVTNVKKGLKDWYKKHPKVKWVAIGLALLATSPLLAQGIMMINSTAWHLFDAIPGKPLCGLLNSINKGLSTFARFGKYSYVDSIGQYTLGGIEGAQAMYSSIGAVLYSALGALGFKRFLKNRKNKQEPIKEEDIPNEIPEEKNENANTEENNISNKPETKDNGYNKGLTPEQIEELKSEGLKPGDPEYIQYLQNHGITPTKEDYIKKQESKDMEYDSRLTEEQINELKAENIKPGDNEYNMYLRNHGIEQKKQENIPEEKTQVKNETLTSDDLRKVQESLAKYEMEINDKNKIINSQQEQIEYLKQQILELKNQKTEETGLRTL